jgi:hypothetical protein
MVHLAGRARAKRVRDQFQDREVFPDFAERLLHCSARHLVDALELLGSTFEKLLLSSFSRRALILGNQAPAQVEKISATNWTSYTGIKSARL